MNEISDRSLPVSLIIVAILFILEGVSSVIEMLMALSQGGIYIDFGVVAIFIGWGLLRLRPGWRTFALVLIWIGMVLAPIFAVLCLALPGPATFSLFGIEATELSKEVACLIALFIFALIIWQYKVLTRPDIRRLFGLVDNR